MQDTSGLKSLLSVSWVYKMFQFIVAGSFARTWLARNYWRLNGGEKVVDVGCGAGIILDALPPNIEYVGFDISKEYIDSAQNKWGNRGTFIVGTATDLLENFDNRLGDADLVMCNGVLHHLEDRESLDVLRLVQKVLKPSGRFVCLEPVFLVHQDWLSRWVLKRDRGCNVRTEKEWKELLSQVFDRFTTSVATSLIRIPYTYIIIEYEQPKSI